ncbi:hypothetical protein [Variovorax sp. PAMC26660]|uniref:hypothetical protein n=1 Tax=Variovorax sp. PAMC26660 TaxID=2762322 RepID=UPI00164D73C6|nr:hypothetical protein [Variovorax sp. PAMC26660]QNK67639.1 hypothetical protein H7F35_31630 [Variovorax sp. PAMC26660]
MKRASAYAVLASELEAFRLLPWPILSEHVIAGPTSKTVDVEGEELQLEIQVSKATTRQQAVRVTAVAFGPSHLQMERLEESVTVAKPDTAQAPQ